MQGGIDRALFSKSVAGRIYGNGPERDPRCEPILNAIKKRRPDLAGELALPLMYGEDPLITGAFREAGDII